MRQVEIEAQVAGRIAEIPFDAGQAVHGGQVLARIEDRESSSAVGAREARLRQADAAMRDARIHFERTRRVREANPDAVSGAALDQARAAYETAQAAKSAAAAELGLAVLTAPFDGVVMRRHLEVGELAVPGKPLMTLYDPTALRLVTDIPLSRFAAIERSTRAIIDIPGRDASVETDALEFLPGADSTTQTVRLRINLPESVEAARAFRPGGFVRLRLAAGKITALTIPSRAVLRRGEITAAYVLEAEGTLAMRHVRLGQPVGKTDIEILSGLAGGETVVVNPMRATVLQRAGTRQ